MGTATKKKTTILFLCTGNSCRSQMAEGWARQLKADEIVAYSAGIEKHGLNPSAVEVMAEAGVDISGQISKTVDELPVSRFDWIITLCGHADETCPYIPGNRLHRGFEDPPRLAEKMAPAERLKPYRKVRDEIQQFVASLPQSLQR
jgi:arsenate reductase